MELPVQCGPAAHIVLIIELVANALSIVEGGLAHIGDCQTNSFYLEQDANFKHLGELGFRDLRHNGALVALKKHQTLCFQTLQSFPYRDFANIEFIGNIILAYWLTLFELAGNNGFAQVFYDHLRCRGRNAKIRCVKHDKWQR